MIHCVKSVRIRSFSDLYFPGKIRTRKTPNMDTFNAVLDTKYVSVRLVHTTFRQATRYILAR